MRDPAFQAVPELVKAMEQLDEEKFAKLMAYLKNPVGRRVRTNNHVERTNRMFRFLEKVRYKWRRRRTLVRFVVMTLDAIWREWTPAEAKEPDLRSRSGGQDAQSMTDNDHVGSHEIVVEISEKSRSSSSPRTFSSREHPFRRMAHSGRPVVAGIALCRVCRPLGSVRAEIPRTDLALLTVRHGRGNKPLGLEHTAKRYT